MAAVSRHHTCLATDDDQDAPVTESEDKDREDVVRYAMVKGENYLVDFILPEHVGVAHSVHHFGRRGIPHRGCTKQS